MKTGAVCAWGSSVCPSRSALHPDSRPSHRYALCPLDCSWIWTTGSSRKKLKGGMRTRSGNLISCLPPCEVTSSGGVLWWKGDPLKVVCSSQLFFILGSCNLSLSISLWDKERVLSAPMLLTWVPALSLEVLFVIWCFVKNFSSYYQNLSTLLGRRRFRSHFIYKQNSNDRMIVSNPSRWSILQSSLQDKNCPPAPGRTGR